MSKVTFSPEVEEALKSLDHDPGYVATKLKYAVGDQVLRLMAEERLSRADLAARLGKSRQYVTKMLKAETNFTLDTIAALGVALEKSVHFAFAEPGIKMSLWRVIDGGKTPSTTLTVETTPRPTEDADFVGTEQPVERGIAPDLPRDEAV